MQSRGCLKPCIRKTILGEDQKAVLQDATAEKQEQSSNHSFVRFLLRDKPGASPHAEHVEKGTEKKL